MKQLNSTILSLLIGSSLFAQVPSYVPTAGLVGWWSFNGNANDVSGNGYDGTVYGATLDEDRNGNASAAYYFSGNSTRISIPNTLPSLDPNVGPGVTVSFWVKSLSMLTANSDIFDLRSTDNSDLHVLVNNPVGGSLQCDMYNGPNPPASVGCYASGSYPSGIWMHITVTQDHATQVSRLYVDNLLACEFIGAVPTLTDPHLNFGSRYDASAVMSQYMVGVLDDFGIWYRVLTAAEIDALYEINTSAEEIAPSSRTVAYPNPTTGSVTIAGEYSSTAAAAVEVVDARGRVMPVVPRTNLSPRTLTLDLSGLPIGLYTLRCGGAVHRVMKQE